MRALAGQRGGELDPLDPFARRKEIVDRAVAAIAEHVGDRQSAVPVRGDLRIIGEQRHRHR
ncbi:MAG: hypothetical protein ACK5AX_36535 [Bradyrhizobium sp.]|uniref:hypothetical protein n=1 Tax=Bradyrhizobium sp. TaxID=376 RepID=UPI0039195610